MTCNVNTDFEGRLAYELRQAHTIDHMNEDEKKKANVTESIARKYEFSALNSSFYADLFSNISFLH